MEGHNQQSEKVIYKWKRNLQSIYLIKGWYPAYIYIFIHSFWTTKNSTTKNKQPAFRNGQKS